MKFGKSLRNAIAETVPEWEGEYISYKDLKKQLKLIVNRSSNTTEDIRFVQLLYSNLNKFQQFFMDKEEEYIIRLQVSCFRKQSTLYVFNHDHKFVFVSGKCRN